MGFIKTRVLVDRPIALHQLPARDVQVLKTVAQGKPLTVANLDLWLSRSAGEQRGVLARIQKSLLERPITGTDRMIADGEAITPSRSTGLALSSRQLVEGVPVEIIDLRRRLPNALWGQEHALEAFEIARKDALSSTRRTSSLLLISGDVAHGKDEALAGFAALLERESTEKPGEMVPAKVIDLNLSGALDRDVDSIFGDDGPLDPKVLNKAATGGNVLVRLRNPPVGQTALAARFNTMFAEDAQWVKALHLVADYDGRGSAHDAFAASFGAQGLRHASADVEFIHLTPEVMIRYADRALTELLTGSRLEGQTPVWDIKARAALARLLATPNEPLDELKPRLQQFVLAHIDTQPSVDPKRSVLKFELGPAFDDPDALDARIAELHRPMARLANDAYAATNSRLFSVDEVARKADLTESEVGLLVNEIVDHTLSVTQLLEGNDEPVERLRQSIEAIVKHSESASTYGWYERVSDRQYKRLEEVLTAIEVDLLEVAAQPMNDETRNHLHQLGASLGDLHAAVALLARKQDDAAQGLSGTTLLNLLLPPAPTNEG